MGTSNLAKFCELRFWLTQGQHVVIYGSPLHKSDHSFGSCFHDLPQMPVPRIEERWRKKNKRGSKEFLFHHPKKLHLGQFLGNLSSTQTKIPNQINFLNQIPMTDFPMTYFLIYNSIFNMWNYNKVTERYHVTKRKWLS